MACTDTHGKDPNDKQNNGTVGVDVSKGAAVYGKQVLRKSVGVSPVCLRNADEK